MTERLYHGGRLDGTRTGCSGLWATDNYAAARQYAESSARGAADYTAAVYEVHVAGPVVLLRDVVDSTLAEQVEAGDPAAIAYADVTDALAERGIWAVLVDTGDEHPTTGTAHRSWWIVGDTDPRPIETVEV